ncbi:MAG: helix-turn-helix domain-containing protein [Actinomycetota bacterium]|nr:helix-turn-helix domain-containing protein [Actinomycetota bacterium]MDQ3954118.1 helix-turn-helix domain-containing protein [Actinomycetota bacterium]
MAAKKTARDPRVQGLPQSPDDSQRVLLPVEAAALLRVSVAQLYHLTSKKQIPFTKVGGALRFDRNALLSFIADGAPPQAPSKRQEGLRNPAERGSTGRGAGTIRRGRERFSFNTPARTGKKK